MPKIKFSHNYDKLHEQKKGILVWVCCLDAKKVNENEALIDYDTRYFIQISPSHSESRYYPLPKEGNLIQLTFLGDKGIPFCTLRSYSVEKYDYYSKLIGILFDIENPEGEP